MTIGIYYLQFAGTDKVYIGQSDNIERRYCEHINRLKAGISNYKLNRAYVELGTPTLVILEICTTGALDTLEISYITKYNSILNGYNISPGGEYFKLGEDNPNAKYTNEQIEEAFILICKNSNTLVEVSNSTKIHCSTIQDIAGGTCYRWLEEKYPKEYSNMLSLIGTRIKNNGKNVKDAAARGIVYPSLVSPYGDIVEISNVNKFAKANGFGPTSIYDVIYGRKDNHKGWVLHK